MGADELGTDEYDADQTDVLSLVDRQFAPESPDPPADGSHAGRPSLLRGSRFDPSGRQVAVLVVLAIVAAAIAGVTAWRARPHESAVGPAAFPAAADAPASGAASATERPSALSPTSTPTSAPTAGAAPTSIVVAVVGKVRKPGLVTLRPDSRVADAIAAAGGAERGVDFSQLNQARKVADGEQIAVGVPGAQPPAGGTAAASPAPGSPASGSSTSGSAASGSSAAGSSATAIDLNTATAEQLDELPGVGPVLAKRILDYRTEHGRFGSIDELQEVSGIGDATYAKIAPMARV